MEQTEADILYAEELKKDKERGKLREMLKKMPGYKFFKDHEDFIEMYRLLKIKADGVLVEDQADMTKTTLSFDFFSELQPLQPDGYFTINTVKIPDGHGNETDDVIVTANKYLNMTIGDTMPYAICRQSITDIFFNLLCETEEDQIVGLSVNRDNCPTNFDIGIMMACNKIVNAQTCFFYREDTLEDILNKYVDTKHADQALNRLYTGHLRYTTNPKAAFRKEDGGWCKDLRTLLRENTFQSDMNDMLGITDVDFKMTDYIVQKELPNGEPYDSVEPDLLVWLAGTFRVAIQDITVLEYAHDINLADFNNASYFFLRDNTKKLYFCVYTVSGQYLQSDLEAEYNKLDVSDRWRIDFYNKYHDYDQKMGVF